MKLIYHEKTQINQPLNVCIAVSLSEAFLYLNMSLYVYILMLDNTNSMFSNHHFKGLHWDFSSKFIWILSNQALKITYFIDNYHKNILGTETNIQGEEGKICSDNLRIILRFHFKCSHSNIVDIILTSLCIYYAPTFV